MFYKLEVPLASHVALHKAFAACPLASRLHRVEEHKPVCDVKVPRAISCHLSYMYIPTYRVVNSCALFCTSGLSVLDMTSKIELPSFNHYHAVSIVYRTAVQ